MTSLVSNAPEEENSSPKDYASMELPTDWKLAFKDADIRGHTPNEVNEAVAYRLGKALIVVFGLTRIVLGRDMRLTSPALHSAFIAGATSEGAEVLDLGLIDTPCLYFVCGTRNEYGAVITASHNPWDYNGFKLVSRGSIPVCNSSGLLDIKSLVESNNFPPRDPSLPLGTVTLYENVEADYAAFVHSKVNFSCSKRLKCVVDYGNGMGSTFAHILKDPRYNLELTELFDTLDGTFPHRGSDPTLRKNQVDIVATLKAGAGAFDMGISFDGDADRVAFFDEQGNFLNCADIGALFAQFYLTRNPPPPTKKFVHNVFTSKIYEETIEADGGQSFLSRVGHSFVKEEMRRHDAIFSCENSGHFYFRDYFYCDSGVLCFLWFLTVVSEALDRGERISGILAPFMKYHQTEEKMIHVDNKEATLNAIRDQYLPLNPRKVGSFDGISVWFDDWWFTVKDSLTEDAVKYVVESADPELAHQKKAEIWQLLERFQHNR